MERFTIWTITNATIAGKEGWGYSLSGKRFYMEMIIPILMDMKTNTVLKGVINTRMTFVFVNYSKLFNFSKDYGRRCHLGQVHLTSQSPKKLIRKKIEYKKCKFKP
eukprot:UN07152